MCVDIILIGIIRGGSGDDEGKMPIRDESLNKPAPIVSDFVEESPIKGTIDFVLDLKLDVQKSNGSIVMIFPWCAKDIVGNTLDGTTFMEYVQFLPSRRLYSTRRSMTSTSMVTVFPPKDW